MSTGGRIAWLALGLACWLAPAHAREAAGAVAATGTVEVAFSPWDDTEALVVRTIESARSRILVQAYLFTSRRLARALIEAKRRGVAVEILADRDMTFSGNGSQIPRLAQVGIPVGIEHRYNAAHNKIILIDPASPRGAVITGSYNFTWAAKARNAENVIVLRDNPALLRAYYDNWRRHREDAMPFEAARPAAR